MDIKPNIGNCDRDAESQRNKSEIKQNIPREKLLNFPKSYMKIHLFDRKFEEYN